MEEFIKKEINKEWCKVVIISIVLAMVIGFTILMFIKNDKSMFEYKEIEYKNVYEFKDTSLFIVDEENGAYIFYPEELGEWAYELENEEELSKIMATYFINKYDIEENVAIQEINNILEELKNYKK